MIQINDITFQADDNKIFIDRETGLINMGSLLQIGQILKDGIAVDDSIDNYEEILYSEFVQNNENYFIRNIKNSI
jgi:hypothetical protein